MILLTFFAFLAGVVTILSPCILPILPIVLSSVVGEEKVSKSRPFGVVVGFIASFTFFTLFLSTIVHLSKIPTGSLRLISIAIIGGFGISFLIPRFQTFIEKTFSKFARLVPQTKNKAGFEGGLFIGFSLGLLWTPCVGPILASVISLAIIGRVTVGAFMITLAYSFGTAIPMFLIMIGGQKLLGKIPWLVKNAAHIQKIFGVIMILTAVAIFTNTDRKFQTYILNKFPQYGVGLTKIEENPLVYKEFRGLNENNLIKAPQIIPGGVWFNSKPLTISQLKGKVVLIDFWTYSCINCQRTLPYIKAWWEKYKNQGLVVVGIHSPEFEFEKNKDNVQKAIDEFGLKYPIVQDNEFATWRAYNNQYWPAKYFIDKDGFIRFTHFGEGEYDKSEQIIQELLAEAGAKNVNKNINNPKYEIYSKTPETYLGLARRDNSVFYKGQWFDTPEYTAPQKGAVLNIDFNAKKVYLVMRVKNGPVKIKVYVDGKSQFFGADNKKGTVTVEENKLYRLVDLPAPGSHTLRLEFESDGVGLYAFTFG